MNDAFRYFKRLCGLPFFAAIILVSMIFHLIKSCYAFMLYGGEAIAYMKKDEYMSINDNYRLLEKKILSDDERRPT